MTPFIVSPATGDTLSTLLSEFYARGFSYLNDGGAGAARATRWLNQAIKELSGRANWPFLEATASGQAPLAVSDLNFVLSVVDSTSGIELQGMDAAGVIQSGSPDLTVTGTPMYWYLQGSVVNVYPANTSDTLSVRYIAVPQDLVADADVSVIPTRYSNIVIDLAVVRGYKDSDNLMAAYAIQSDVDSKVQDMLENELVRGDSSFVRVTGAAEDW